MWTELSMSYLEKFHDAEDPFFLYLAYTTPHEGRLNKVEDENYPIPHKYR